MRPNLQWVSVVVLAGILLLAAGCPKPTTTGAPPNTIVGPRPKAPVPSTEPDKATIPIITRGEKVDIKQHLVAGKITIVDFYSDYCPACRMLAPELEELVAKRSDIAVVKVDVNRPNVEGIDWNSPVARQYKLEALPHLVIFDKDGKEIASGEAAREKVAEWLGG